MCLWLIFIRKITIVQDLIYAIHTIHSYQPGLVCILWLTVVDYLG